jgi:glycosyltransferase involved in cell wall biosynthesis
MVGKMASKQLTEIYLELLPNISKLYVVPNIKRFSKHNHYLELLYADLMEQSPQIALESFSFIPPSIVFRRLIGEKSVVHHHWFECSNFGGVLKLLWKLIILGAYRLFGGKIVWTIHNRQPHHHKWRTVNRILRKFWSRYPHRIHVHCASIISELAAQFGIAEHLFFVIPHPPYPVVKTQKQQALKQLLEYYPDIQIDPNQPIYLMFGYIAPYKKIAEVAELFATSLKDKQLLIAGAIKPDGAREAKRIRELKATNVIFIDRHIADKHVAYFFNSASAAIFNFSDILASGSVELARNYGLTLFLPRIGCLKEISGDHIYHFSTQEELINHLKYAPIINE